MSFGAQYRRFPDFKQIYSSINPQEKVFPKARRFCGKNRTWLWSRVPKRRSSIRGLQFQTR